MGGWRGSRWGNEEACSLRPIVGAQRGWACQRAQGVVAVSDERRGRNEEGRGPPQCTAYRCIADFCLTNRFLLLGVSTGPTDFLLSLSCSARLAAFALPAMSNGILALLLSPASGVDVAKGE